MAVDTLGHLIDLTVTSANKQEREDFFIFDFCQNLEFFSQNLEGSAGALAELLSQKLFKLRLEMLGVLDQRRVQGHHLADTPAQAFALTEDGIRSDIAGLLQRTVAGMSLDNFVVRPQRRRVEAWAQPGAWTRPSTEQLQEVAQHLSGLPSSVRDDDEDAKRFDLLMLQVQLCSLRAEPGLARLQWRVQQLANAL